MSSAKVISNEFEVITLINDPVILCCSCLSIIIIILILFNL